MGFTFKFPLKISTNNLKHQIKEAQKRGQLKEKPLITFAKKSNQGEIKVETWEDLLLVYFPVAIGLDEVFKWEVVDDDTGERVNSRILDTLQPYILNEGVHTLTRQRIKNECKPYKSSNGSLGSNKTYRKKRRR